MTDIGDILIKTRALIAEERSWCRGKSALDEAGESIETRSKKAVRRCLDGALIAAFPGHPLDYGELYEGYDAITGILNRLARDMFTGEIMGIPLICVNDHLGHEAVMKLLDRAIEEVETSKATRRLLLRARALILDEGHWCQGHSALAADGSPVGNYSANAVRFCATGAIFHLGGDGSSYYTELRAMDLLDNICAGLYPDLGPCGGDRPIVRVNDTIGHAAVLKVYDHAIASLQEGA